jgi:hypothetical protein
VNTNPSIKSACAALLFNNPYVEAIRERSVSDDEKWREWSALFAQDATKLGDEDMGYLRKAFTKLRRLRQGHRAPALIGLRGPQQQALELQVRLPFRPRRDLRGLADRLGRSEQRPRFFARTGELLYLMLSRAARGPELGAQKLVERLFNRSAPMNRLVRALQGEPQTASNPRDVGYLPYAKHPRFDQICEDWLAILAKDMPIYDALEHLITSGLELALVLSSSGQVHLRRRRAGGVRLRNRLQGADQGSGALWRQLPVQPRPVAQGASGLPRRASPLCPSGPRPRPSPTIPTPSAPSSCASASSGPRQTAATMTTTRQVRNELVEIWCWHSAPRAARRQDSRVLVAGHWAQLAQACPPHAIRAQRPALQDDGGGHRR